VPVGPGVEAALPGIGISHSGGPQAGARRGGAVGASVMKPMMRISAPQRGE